MASEQRCVYRGSAEAGVLCCAFNATRREAYTGGRDNAICCWDHDSGQLLRRLEAHRCERIGVFAAAATLLLLLCCSVLLRRLVRGATGSGCC